MFYTDSVVRDLMTPDVREVYDSLCLQSEEINVDIQALEFDCCGYEQRIEDLESSSSEQDSFDDELQELKSIVDDFTTRILALSEIDSHLREEIEGLEVF